MPEIIRYILILSVNHSTWIGKLAMTLVFMTSGQEQRNFESCSLFSTEVMYCKATVCQDYIPWQNFLQNFGIFGNLSVRNATFKTVRYKKMQAPEGATPINTLHVE